MSTSMLLVYIFLGSASLSYMLYARNQRKAVALLCGIGLGVLPYFDLSLWLTVLLALIVMILPFILNK